MVVRRDSGLKENDNEMMIMLIAFYGIFACVSCAFVFVLVSGKENEVWS